MRSLSTRMLAAALGTLVVSFVAFVVVFFAQSAPQVATLFHRFQALQLEDAVAAFARGGAPEASAYLNRLSNKLGFVYYLTDERGRDVLAGDDRSALLGPAPFNQPRQVGDRIVLTESSSDGRFHLLILAPPPFRVLDFLPYYLLITGAVALFWWLLAVGVASPIRQLTATVDRFGRGDLQSRATSARRDEVGNLARAFNDMAERIQTLLTAERQLLQDISHELRSPLTRLSIGIELLRTTPDRAQAVDRLQTEVERLTTLVGSLIEVTRSEGDPASRKSEIIDIVAIVRETVAGCELESDLRGCRVVLAGDATRILRGDPELIRRAIENVLRNAIRYAPPDTAVNVHLAEEPTGTVISVRDHGPGVPETLLPRLTDPFFRVDAARDVHTGGVGLGLAIARRALYLHHGHLSAENANPGLRMILTIPHGQFGDAEPARAEIGMDA
jgi:two-component system sensor histidine kinase CpxA